MPDDLTPFFDFYSARLLRAICGHHGHAPRDPKNKAELMATLSRLLPHREVVEAEWQRLGEVERAVVEGLQRRGGRASVRALAETLVRQGVVDRKTLPSTDPYHPAPPPNARARNSRRLQDALASLILRGLVFAEAGHDLRANYQAPKFELDQAPAVVVIPAPILRHLPPVAPAPPSVKAVPVTVAAAGESSARTFQRDLYLYWSYARDRAVYVTLKDEAQKADLKKINALLLVRETLGKGEGELDHPRLRFVRQMLMALDLLAAQTGGDALRATPAPGFFAEAPAERVQRTFEIWRQNVYFNELLLLPLAARPERGEANLLAAPALVVEARQAVLQAVAGLARQVPPGEWLPLETLADTLRADDYEFLFPRRPPPTVYAYYAPPHPYAAETNPLGLAFPDVRKEDEGWNLVEASFIRGVVLGPLFWMGLADKGWVTAAGAEAPPEAFRLTALGRWVLGLGPRPEIPAEGGRVIVQPNLHIVALDPVNDGTLVALDRFAERLTAERAVEYQLTRASVYAAQQGGWNVPRIKAFLTETAAAELPANVARTLDEWQTQHERIRLYPSVALVHGPAEVLTTLTADGARRAAPEVLLLSGAPAVPGLVAALRARDILPLVSTQATVPPGSVQADETGGLRLMVARPSLYLHGHLAAFADPRDVDRYQITADTVSRAMRAGVAAPEILARLAAVHRGPVPEALARRIRAWARHFGAAGLASRVLLQVRDAATLAELRADPELAPLLHDFAPAPEKALASVRPEEVEKLRQLLAERGVELGDVLE